MCSQFQLILTKITLSIVFSRIYVGVKNDWFEQVLSQTAKGPYSYKTELIERLLHIITLTNQPCMNA